MSLAARIEGVGLVGPGFTSWAQGREVLAGRVSHEDTATVMPVPEALPPTERRRAGKAVKLSLAAGLEAAAQAGREARDLVAIFASSGADGDNCHAICAALASDDRLISPTRFHNSVHNAPAGYWSIATGATHPVDCVAGFDASFGAGLLEALARVADDAARPVLLIAYDSPYPQPLQAARPLPDGFAMALLLAADDGGRGPRVAVQPAAHAAPTRLAAPTLEAMRSGIPAARALPLLELLARGASGSCIVEYLDDLALRIEVAA